MKYINFVINCIDFIFSVDKCKKFILHKIWSFERPNKIIKFFNHDVLTIHFKYFLNFWSLKRPIRYIRVKHNQQWNSLYYLQI